MSGRTGDLPPDHLAARLLRFAEIAGPDSPLSAAFARAAAHDPVAARILAATPAHLPSANVLLAAVHHLLLGGVGHDLAGHYPDLAPAGTTPVGDPGEQFVAFCREHEAALAALAATRGVQTNEVRRCVILVPAFTRIARAERRPLAIVEVGASAGLTLCFDRYGYDYGRAAVGVPAPLVLTTEVRAGDPPIPERLPEVAWRTGIDLDPIDLGDAEAVRWARALLWPEQLDRVARFEAAVALVRPDPPSIVRGDALDVLPDVAAEAPADAALVVVHSFVLNQFSDEQRDRFAAILDGIGRTRTVHRVGIESLRRDMANPEATHAEYRDGEVTHTLLGPVHHHGGWITWAV